MEHVQGFLLFALGLAVFHSLRYLAIAGGAYALFWGRLRAWTESRRLQPQLRPRSESLPESRFLGIFSDPAFPAEQLRREIRQSLITAIIFGILFVPVAWPVLRQYTAIYTHFSDHSLLYALLSFFFLVLVHDTYFYWMHRWIHHPRLFKWIHAAHHESRSPNPMTAYSFSAKEAILEFIWIWPLLMVIPFHPTVLTLFGLFSLSLNVIGHLGFEIYPESFKTHPIWGWLNRPGYHDEHHLRSRGNYGLYFVFWDRWMGTLVDSRAARCTATSVPNARINQIVSKNINTKVNIYKILN